MGKNDRTAIIVGLGSFFTNELAKSLKKFSRVFLLGSDTETRFMKRKLGFLGEELQVQSIHFFAIHSFVHLIGKSVDIFVDTASFFRASEALRIRYYSLLDQFVVLQGKKRLILISTMYDNEYSAQTTCLMHNYSKKIKLLLFRIPLLIHKPLRGNVELPCHLHYYMQKFKKWIEDRQKKYFQNSVLHICIGEDRTVSLISQEEVLARLCTYMEQSNGTEIQITGPFKTNNLQLIQELGKTLGITIQNVKDESEFNEVDSLFANVLKRFLPEFAEATWEANGQEELISDDLTAYLADSIFRMQKFTYGHPRNFVSSILKKTGIFPDHLEHVYYFSGKGEPILIVNALGAAVGAWQSFINELSKLYSVYIWETRGVFMNTHSDFQIKNYNLEAQINEIKWISDRENLEPFHILAWCSGAKSAFAYAKAYPDRVKSLIVLAGDFLPFEGYHGKRAKFMDDLEVISDLISNKNKMLKYYLQLIYRGNFNKADDSDNALAHKKILEIMPEPYRKFFFSQFSDLNQSINFFKICIDYYKHDISALIRDTDKPVLLIAAEEDIVSPLEQSAFVVQYLRNGSLRVLPATTHVMMLERVDEIIDLIECHMLALEGSDEISAIFQEDGDSIEKNLCHNTIQ